MPFVALHGGAGSHSSSSEKEIKRALRAACQNALSGQRSQVSALDIVEDAIVALEDDELFNSGFGSNLTLDGTIECDASIMGGEGLFGSVGAVSGVKNPIRLARAVLNHSRTTDPLGRIPPLTLVSEGAKSFAVRHGIPIIDPASLVSDKARNTWTRWKHQLESGVSPSKEEEVSDLQDTVGAVALCGNEIAAGVSRSGDQLPFETFVDPKRNDSGGILLKFPGRMGEAGVFGAGCWTEEAEHRSVACSVSGAGEYIVRAALARSLGRTIAHSEEDDDPHDIIYRLLEEDFWRPSRKLGEPQPNVGVLLLVKEKDNDRTIVRLWCAFTTASMAVAFASTDNPKPKAFVLRQPSPPSSSSSPDNSPRIFITAYTL